jgi:hypothetical protein
MFDLPEQAGGGLHYSVRSESGMDIFKMDGGPERGGERVTLSIPRLEAAPGRYAFVISGQNNTEIARFPLAVR